MRGELGRERKAEARVMRTTIIPLRAASFMAALCVLAGTPVDAGGCYWLLRLVTNVATFAADGEPLSGAWS